MKSGIRKMLVLATIVVGSLGIVGETAGQTVGEFRSRQSGDWNTPGPDGTWEQWNGTAWVTENEVVTPGEVTIAGDGFPEIAGTATSSKDNTTNAAHVISLPAGIDPGDLLIIFWTDASVVNTTPALPSDWTLLVTSNNGDGDVYRRIWYKIADGTEGSTVSTTNSFGDRSSHVVYRIAAGSFTLTGTPFVSAANNDNDDNPNPPSLAPGQGSQKFLWLASTHAAESQTFSIPTDFSNTIDSRTISSSTSSDHCQTITARRFFEVDLLDVGAFSLGGDATHTAWAIAIQGIGVSGTYPNPVIVGAIFGSQNSDAGSHTISIPFGDVDDLLVVVFSVDGNPTVSVGTGSGWTKLGQQSNSTTVTGAIYWKMATGTDNLTLSTNANEQSSHITYRIRGATAISGAAADGSSTNSNPPSHMAGEASFLWIATRSGDNTTVASSPPTGYSNMITRAASGGGGASTNTATNILGTAATTEDPGTFTSPNEQWVSWTLAIEGPAPVITFDPIEYPYLSSTFPEVSATNTSTHVFDNSVHTINLPSGIESDDLLLIFWTDANQNSTAPALPAGWTSLYAVNDGNMSRRAWYRVADGAEGSSVSTTNSFQERSAHVTYRIAAGTYSGTPTFTTVGQTTSTNPNPPNHTPSGGLDNYLWLATTHAAGFDADTDPSGTPSNYTDLVSAHSNSGGSANSVRTFSARRELNALSEDPGTFTWTLSTTWVTSTIAIQGAPIPAIATILPTHTVTVTQDVTVDELTIETGGILSVGAGQTLTIPAGGALTNSGSIQGTGEIDLSGGTYAGDGAIAPGNSVGILTITGSVAVSGTYDVEITGPPSGGPGVTFDQLVVSGTATIGGTIAVDFGSYTPTPGMMYPIVLAGMYAGTPSISVSPGTITASYSGGVLTILTALPVTWLSFRATLNEGKNVDLLWSTASESNNEGFDVERSANGRDWETIAFVPGAGTTSEVQNYQYIDESPVTSHQSLIYYRLKQRDFSGAFEYSPVRTIELGNQNGIRVYPNPAHEEVTISFAQPTEGGGTARLYTQNNRLVAEYTIPPQTSDYPVRVAGLPAGIYVLQVVVGNEEWSKRVVVE